MELVRMVIVGGKNSAVFHGWGVNGWAVRDYGNQTVGAINQTQAIVEYEDGSCELVDVNEIRFVPPSLQPEETPAQIS